MGPPRRGPNQQQAPASLPLEHACSAAIHRCVQAMPPHCEAIIRPALPPRVAGIPRGAHLDLCQVFCGTAGPGGRCVIANDNVASLDYMHWLGDPNSVGWSLLLERLQRQGSDGSAAQQAGTATGGGRSGISMGVLIGCIVAAVGELFIRG